uniref:Chaperone protein DnaJ n=1 Tax=uncultured marine group II/III euryarchaeote KM3_99_A09 TaxID=1456549 RepID=A0A075I5V0_9EURY|nr:chaperone protein (dnaJ) [uncultured marine group II/III euryarchaeote KM3_99_A09]
MFQVAKRDYYEVLEIGRDSTASEVKKAFRTLARRNHPDKNPDDPEAENRFKEIQEAYAVLSNPDQRQRYDTFGHEQPGGGPFGPGGFDGVNISVDDLFSGGFESIFSSMFGAQGGRRTNRGNDVMIRHTIPFEMVLDGGDQELEAELKIPCGTCDGRGSATPEGVQTCHSCRGAGRVTQHRKIGPFVQQVVGDCPDCGGDGRTITDPCKSCKGSASEHKIRKIRFSVPRGVSAGTRLRLSERGEPARGGNGRRGDLYIQIDIKDHGWFERDGSDLLMALPLGYPELLLGTTVTLPHIDGDTLEIKVPAGSRPGETIMVRRRGFPRPRGRGRGDITVLLKLHVPKKVSKGLKKQIADLQEEISISDDDYEEFVRAEAKDRRHSR